MTDKWYVVLSVPMALATVNYLIRKARFSVKPGELRYGVSMKGSGIGCLLLACALLFILMSGRYQVHKPGEANALISLIVLSSLFAIYLILEALQVKGHFDDASIQFNTPWTGQKCERWEDLESASHSSWCQWYVLKFKSGKVIRVSTMLGGHGYLNEFLRQRGYQCT